MKESSLDAEQNPVPVSVSPSEWEILSIVWKGEPLTAAQVVEQLPKHLEWHPKTVGTFLTRLVEKGIVTATRQGKANVYTSVYSREQLVADESETFLKRVFRGARKPLLMHFVEQGNFTDEEIEELKALLDRQRNRTDTEEM